MGNISGSVFVIFVYAFLIQVLGAKYKHELLVDHSFSDSSGSCGNFLLILTRTLFASFFLLHTSIHIMFMFCLELIEIDR